MAISPLAPDHFPALPAIRGVRITSAASGMKYQGRDDMMAMLIDPGSYVAGVFTTSDTAAPAVIWSRDHCHQNGDQNIRAIITNAGNANAFTGQQGAEDVQMLCTDFAHYLDGQNINAENILIASTGVIGEPLDCACLRSHFATLASAPDAGWENGAAAILTTDTFAKGASATAQIDGIEVTICGIAKGSGMIAPNMATMLGYVATDAAIGPAALKQILTNASNRSFNAITVDSDTSTSDSVFLVATGKAGNAEINDADDPRLDGFCAALDQVMQDLAKQIVRDGEGAEKLITIDVAGAADDARAHKIGMSIANSPLVKTAIAGGDANWGRVVMAVGKAGANIDQRELSIAVGGVTIAQNGARLDGYDETPVAKHMTGSDINIAVTVGSGTGTARVWTCDLTHGYITINADYRS
ncbi:bifunctional glutamate N-acetyltransferase/amino-acid acetyltransferase ArgJ [Alphaproteobacteria bacterium]|nr:bifunctional glutamate N-acetyltransferase/amino-acid acetyltransferase ArgJ [Alphaproteobacteria bacterium]